MAEEKRSCENCGHCEETHETYVDYHSSDGLKHGKKYLGCDMHDCSPITNFDANECEDYYAYTCKCPICGADKDSDNTCETCNDDARNLER